MKSNETILNPSDLFANEAEFNTDNLANAAALLAEDAEYFAAKAEAAAKRAADILAAFIQAKAEAAEESAAALAVCIANQEAEEAEEAAEESAAEYHAATDLVKTAAAVAFGFVGFYLIFAIFGI